MDIRSLIPVEPYGSNCYLISSSDEFAVIDPSADYFETLAKYPQIEGKVKCVLLTHAHFDHFLAIDSWVDKCETVFIGVNDAPSLSNPSLNCYLGFLGVEDGYYGDFRCLTASDVIKLGSEEISVIECPGHTPGGLSYKAGNIVFCGDTLFANGGYGRCDLPGGDIDVLEKTLIKLITHLPEETIFYPGHGQSTTLKELIYYFM